MSTRKETERTKFIQDKCQSLLTQMLRDEDNKYCVDCDAKGKVQYTEIYENRINSWIINRSTMGFLELGRVSMYPVRRNSSESRCSHITC